MQNLFVRSLSALVYAALFIIAIFFSSTTYIGIVLLFSAGCLLEFNKMIALKNGIPLLILAIAAYVFKTYLSDSRLLFLVAVTLICSLQLIYFVFKGTKQYPSVLLDKVDVAVRYIIFSFCFLMLLPFYKGHYNPYIILYVLLLIWSNDTFAFITGKKFGKHKLLEKVSPKKTIEGFLGGVLFSILVGGTIGTLDTQTSFKYHWIAIAGMVSIFGTLGDLVESKFKRQAGVKDSGTIMPGHGGLLDRLDSLFFLTPFVYLYIHYVI